RRAVLRVERLAVGARSGRVRAEVVVERHVLLEDDHDVAYWGRRRGRTNRASTDVRRRDQGGRTDQCECDGNAASAPPTNLHAQSLAKADEQPVAKGLSQFGFFLKPKRWQPNRWHRDAYVSRQTPRPLGGNPLRRNASRSSHVGEIRFLSSPSDP